MRSACQGSKFAVDPGSQDPSTMTRMQKNVNWDAYADSTRYGKATEFTQCTVDENWVHAPLLAAASNTTLFTALLVTSLLAG